MTRAAPASSAGPLLSRRLLREPLLHFLVAGGLLFAGYRVLNPVPETVDQTSVIELTPSDLRQLAVTWMAQGRPAPNPAQLRGLVEQKVAEEVLVREALALGLDKDDEIIKRRLAQKMDFLAEDVAALREPSVAELQAWYAQHPAPFALPPRASFRHLYFSFDRHGQAARDVAATALPKVAGLSADSPAAAALADPFMFQDFYGDRGPEQLAKEFGPNFADALFRLAAGSWQGPIPSGYGWHLVWIEGLTPGRVPAFEEVEPDVRAAWLENQRQEVKRTAFEAMRAAYTVVVPPIETVDLQGLRVLQPPATPANLAGQ